MPFGCLGSLSLLLLGTHISDRGVFDAIGLPRKRASAAETEVLVGRVAGGPQTARPAEFEEVALRRGDRCACAPRQRDAVQLADDRVFREAQPAPDLGRREPLLE